MRIFEKVRMYIDSEGINQIAVAEKAGFSASEFYAILNGERTMYAEDLQRICWALNVNPELFFEPESA